MFIVKLTDLRIRYFFVLWVVSLLLSSCADNKPIYNVIIVTFDTTRADHVGAYNGQDYTPTIDALAADGVVYRNAIAAIPITLPSHSTIMTGKVPFTHGVRDNGLFNLTDEQTTLAEILKQHGYNTAAAIGSFPLTAQFGLNQGFDFYNDYITQNREDIFGEFSEVKSHLFFDERKAAQVNEAIMPWLKNNANKPFFAWIHYFDPHHPHEPPAPYNQSFVHDLYKGEIAYADETLGKVIEQLKRLKAYDNTLIIFASDHGEGNFEHNESTHSLLIYNSTLHVPLIVKYPHQLHANTFIDSWVGLVDVFPTVLNTLGLPLPNDIQGQVLPTQNDDNSPTELYIESLSARFSRGWGEQRGLIKNDHKYIYGPQKELYDLKLDAKEINNLILQQPQLAASMQADLHEYIEENQVTANPNSSLNLDPETLNTLRGLGYIQSTGNAVEVFVEKLDDTGDAPQIHASTNSDYSTAKDLLYKGRFIDSIRYLDALLAEDPHSIAYIELKIQAEMGLGNYASVGSLIAHLPADNYGSITPAKKLYTLGLIAYKQNDLNTAYQHFTASEAIAISISGQWYLSKIGQRQNDLLAQQKHLQKIVAMDAANILVLNELAMSYANTDDFMLAEQTFEQVINSNPFHPLSRYNYGVFLNTLGDSTSALKQFNKAIEIQPTYLLAHYAVLEIYILHNNHEQAKKSFAVLSTIAPAHPLTLKAQELMKKL